MLKDPIRKLSKSLSLFAIAVALVVVATTSLHASPVPEIDPKGGMDAFVLILGSALVLRRYIRG